MKTLFPTLILAILLFSACKKDEENPVPSPTESSLYFPPVSGDSWDSPGFAGAGWDTTGVADLYHFLESNGTRAFIILYNGKIITEKYWGSDLAGNDFTQTSKWYWASAGKTLTAFLTGIAQNQGLLNIDAKTSDYLGTGWTAMAPEKEALIHIRHQLTMTSGIDFNTSDPSCMDPGCLHFKADAGVEWYYNNAVYTLLHPVIENASGISINTFTNQMLASKIGMSGIWVNSPTNHVYWSTARDAARFGLLMLNRGIWNSDSVLTNPNWYDDMVHPSQSLNPSYGYLTWLNGQNKIVYPGYTTPVNHQLAESAPADLYAAIGKNGQFIDVVPSRKLVVIRMGEAPDASMVPVEFHNSLWSRLTVIIP